MTTLSRITHEPYEEAWATEDYVLLPRGVDEDPAYGYEIINRNTAQIELRIDQEPQAIMAMFWLQEQYDEIMKDPAREYNARKPRQGGIATAQPRIMN